MASAIVKVAELARPRISTGNGQSVYMLQMYGVVSYARHRPSGQSHQIDAKRTLSMHIRRDKKLHTLSLYARDHHVDYTLVRSTAQLLP